MGRTMSERVMFLIQCTGCVLGIRCLTTIEFMHACWVGKGQLSKSNFLFNEGLWGGHARYHTCLILAMYGMCCTMRCMCCIMCSIMYDLCCIMYVLCHVRPVLHHVCVVSCTACVASCICYVMYHLCCIINMTWVASCMTCVVSCLTCCIMYDMHHVGHVLFMCAMC